MQLERVAVLAAHLCAVDTMPPQDCSQTLRRSSLMNVPLLLFVSLMKTWAGQQALAGGQTATLLLSAQISACVLDRTLLSKMKLSLAGMDLPGTARPTCGKP